MISISNILTIARYEIKTLLRSWFFRIFASLSILFLTFINIAWFTDAFEVMPWSFRGIPGSIPYLNMILLNLAQSVIAIFLASDFIKRDRKSNTTEVIYMRSMSNADYILGKTFGLFLVFLGLNILMLAIAALINVVFSDVPFQFMVYCYYLILISLPTLIFVFGLSFFVMSIVGNQAVTFLLLLGYFAISLAVLNFKYHALFDSMAFFLPLAYSDFVGFGHLSELVLQRLAYFSIGMGLIFVSILLFKRLPQSRVMQMVSRILAVLFIALGIGAFTKYVGHAERGKPLRQEMRQLNDEYADEAVPVVNKYDLDLSHTSDKIEVRAVLTLGNNSDNTIAKFLFTLNPGLTITQVKVDGVEADAKREAHLLFIKPAQTLEPGKTATVELSYRGTIDEAACYVAADEAKRDSLKTLMLYRLGKRSTFLSENYVLLTSEAAWYPVPGVGYGEGLINPRIRQFSEYNLRVRTKEGLTAISQGTVKAQGSEFQFTAETPLPQISLVIGPYTSRSITVDSVTFNLYTHPEHTYFVENTDALSDTLGAMIKELKNDYELKTSIDYPFSSFSLIEVPIHFDPLAEPLKLGKDYVQPSQVLLPENGAYISEADFKFGIERTMDRLQDRNQSMSETELQYQVVRRFFDATLLGGFSFGRFRGPNMSMEQGSFSIFPNYFSFLNNFQSEEMPIFNTALEAYLKSKVEASNRMGFMRFREAITAEERAILNLNGKSFRQVLSDPEKRAIADNLLSPKSSYLFRLIESKVGKEPLQSFLQETLSAYRFRTTPTQEFISRLEKKFGINMAGVLNDWFEEQTVPGFFFTDFKNYKVLDGDRQRYQVMVTIYNMSEVDGVVIVDFFIPGGRRGFGRFNPGASDYERAVFVPAGRAKQIAILTDEQPRALTFNTLVSQNIPSQTVHNFEEFEENKKAAPLSVERLLDEVPSLTVPGEYIVDNEDEGFKILSSGKKTPLQRLLRIEDKTEDQYRAFSPWRGPQSWKNSINSLFYGILVHSAHFIRGGDGSKKVAWEVDLPTAGQYAVYAYTERLPFRGRGGRGRNFMRDFHYFIYHDDGIEEVEWSAESAEGWNYLGSFYFSAGVNKVELTDESKGRVVVADAMKWVKQ